MVLPQSQLLKCIGFSLIVHLSVVAVLMSLEFKHNHQIPIEISFSQGAIGDGKAKGAKIITAKKLAPVIKPAIKSEVVSDVTKSEPTKEVNEGLRGEGGTGTNIGTGKDGDGYGSGAGAETAMNKYHSLVAQEIYKIKKYPRQAQSLHQEGTVVISFKLNKVGKILELKVLEKAPFKSLTNAAIETINSIRNFPSIPDELNLEEITLIIPIEYKIQM